MTRPFLLHLLFMILGYALAVLVSVTVACVVMGLPTVLPDKGSWGSFYLFWRDFPNLFLGGLMITSLYALPGWLISVVTAENRRERRRYWFAAAGTLTALLALFLAGMGRGLLWKPCSRARSSAGFSAGWPTGRQRGAIQAVGAGGWNRPSLLIQLTNGR